MGDHAGIGRSGGGLARRSLQLPSGVVVTVKETLVNKT